MFNSLSNTEIKNYAKQLRKEMTRQERHLWYDFLQKHRCKWYKQKPIGRYIADFYCGRIKLIVELDGSQHYEEKQVEYDERRTEYFKNLGITFNRPGFQEMIADVEAGIVKRVIIKDMSAKGIH